MPTPKHVLDGFRVLDFTQYLAGPTTTRFPAEMGAEVIKVKLAPVGDYGRFIPYVHDGRSAFFVQQNRGKKSFCIDVRAPEGLALIKEMIPKVDVMVENFSPGTMERSPAQFAPSGHSRTYCTAPDRGGDCQGLAHLLAHPEIRRTNPALDQAR